jgi:hypothetical protein
LNSAGLGWKGPGEGGGVNAPAATLWAEVIATFDRCSLERLSQVDPPVGAAAMEAAESRSAAIENFSMGISLMIWRNYIPADRNSFRAGHAILRSKLFD